LSGLLERGVVALVPQTLHAWQGVSVIGTAPTGAPRTESLTMFNSRVVLVGDFSSVEPTEAYDPLVWIHEDDFLAAYRDLDPEKLGEPISSTASAMYGLCVESTYRALNHQSELSHEPFTAEC
jgi:hypothetical protein